MQGLHGRVWQVGDLPANHRASECALERCLEGFAVKAAEAEFMDREMKALQKRYEAEKVKIRAQMVAEQGARW